MNSEPDHHRIRPVRLRREVWDGPSHEKLLPVAFLIGLALMGLWYAWDYRPLKEEVLMLRTQLDALSSKRSGASTHPSEHSSDVEQSLWATKAGRIMKSNARPSPRETPLGSIRPY